MADSEWQDWQSAWRAEQRPMPHVLVRASSDRQRAVIGTVVFFAIEAVLCGVGISMLRTAHTARATASAVLLLGFCVAYAFGFLWSMRGSWRSAPPTPSGLLDALEKRHQARRRLIPLIWAATAVITSGTLGLALWAAVEKGWAELTGPALTFLFTWAFAALVIRRVSAVIARERSEAELVRKLLQDEPKD